MSGKLSTHVLDLTKGKPAEGMRVELFRLSDGRFDATLVRACRTNADGRTNEPLLAGASLAAGTYELVFHIGEYFGGGAEKPDGFLLQAPVRFRVADPDGSYHVPLLAAPGGYSTYRGS